MSFINTYPKKNTNILRINFEKKVIKVNPEYQRNGDIWSLEKRQLLIDSILNDYDLPKLYFHALDMKEKNKSGIEYAVIDGRQRLETIWKFIDGDFPLADDFVYYKNPKVKAAKLTYADLAINYPQLKMIFDSFELPIILVETDDLELIDDMFSRLNEAVPLNAAEKRNAFGGPMAKAINNVAQHNFFINKVRFSNHRYQYKEVAARLLFLLHSIQRKKIIDTKKVYLDSFVKEFKDNKKLNTKAIEKEALDLLDIMDGIFSKKDVLLKSQGIVPIYFLLFKEADASSMLGKIGRSGLLQFQHSIKKNKEIAEQDITKANFDLIEFDRLSQQGTNDANSIKERLRIIKEKFGI